MYITKQKQTHRHRGQASGYQWLIPNQGYGIKKYKLLYIYIIDKQQRYIV